jgi:hypothetical protein
MNILLVAPFLDKLTGESIFYTLVKEHRVAPFDQRVLAEKFGIDGMNRKLIDDCNALNPDLVLIIKGMEIKPVTLRLLKMKRKVALWNLDFTTFKKKLPESTYLEHIKNVNYFFTTVKGFVPELKKSNPNTFYLAQGCDPIKNKPSVFNHYQKKIFGADVSFIGNLGVEMFHPGRMELLEYIIDNGINLKIFGDFFHDAKVSEKLKKHHTGFSVRNEFFSTACGASKIVIGMDAHPEIELANSVKLYRVLCAGGFYLTNRTKGLDKIFKDGVHLVYYDNKKDLIEKIIYYLTHETERKKIAEAGRKEVLKHTYEARLKELIEIVKK